MDLVVVDGRDVPEAEFDAGGLLPVGGEASHDVELRDEVTTVFDEEREGPAGFDRRHLGTVSDQQDLRAGCRGGTDELVEGERPSERGFVDHDELVPA